MELEVGLSNLWDTLGIAVQGVARTEEPIIVLGSLGAEPDWPPLALFDWGCDASSGL